MHLFGIDVESAVGDNMAKVFDRWLAEVTFGKFAKPSCVGEACEHFAKVLNMFGRCTRIDENVIQVDNDIFIKKVIEEGIHGGLECGGCVARPNGMTLNWYVL